MKKFSKFFLKYFLTSIVIALCSLCFLGCKYQKNEKLKSEPKIAELVPFEGTDSVYFRISADDSTKVEISCCIVNIIKRNISSLINEVDVTQNSSVDKPFYLSVASLDKRFDGKDCYITLTVSNYLTDKGEKQKSYDFFFADEKEWDTWEHWFSMGIKGNDIIVFQLKQSEQKYKDVGNVCFNPATNHVDFLIDDIESSLLPDSWLRHHNSYEDTKEFVNLLNKKTHEFISLKKMLKK